MKVVFSVNGYNWFNKSEFSICRGKNELVKAKLCHGTCEAIFGGGLGNFEMLAQAVGKCWGWQIGKVSIIKS